MSSQPPTENCAHHPVPPPNTSITLPLPSCPTHPWSSIPIDSCAERSSTAENHARHWTGNPKKHDDCKYQVISIDTLPDEVLLEIFDFCVDDESEDQVSKKCIEAWQLLVHVCRRWRSIVFGSPLRLNLQLVGTTKTPVTDTLDVWPPVLPLVFHGSYPPQILAEDYKDTTYEKEQDGLDNIIALLQHRHRVCQIFLEITRRYTLKDIIKATMQVPFPELTILELSSYDVMLPLRESFLGGSAPSLRKLQLDGIPFPGLPRLLLSATHLVDLRLCNVPFSGNIPPDTLVNALSTLINLKSLLLQFTITYPQIDPPPPTRTVLPALTDFEFKGYSEYLEDFVALIDAPLLYALYVDPLTLSQIRLDQFTQFIGRTPKLKAFKEARVYFSANTAWMELSSTSGYRVLNVTVSSSYRLSHLEQVCTSLPPISTPEVLYVCEAPDWEGNLKNEGFENTLWLALLRPFIAVRDLYLSKVIAPRIVPALEETVIGGTTVLPSLQNIFLEELQSSGPIQEAIGQFIAARQATSHPIAVSCWERRRGS